MERREAQRRSALARRGGIPPDALASSVGELRLLHHDKDAASVEADIRSRPAGLCVLAVRVRAATFTKGAARFTLDTPYGDRRAMIRDPFGNLFQIAHKP